MLKLITVEEQRARRQFRYEKVLLVLVSQTKFDQVVTKEKDPSKSP